MASIGVGVFDPFGANEHAAAQGTGLQRRGALHYTLDRLVMVQARHAVAAAKKLQLNLPPGVQACGKEVF